ncbi:hypothetical protein IWQ61_004455, partial [Dispira simplex]
EYPSAEEAAENQVAPELPPAATEISKEKVQQPHLPQEQVDNVTAFFDSFNPAPTELAQQPSIPDSQAAREYQPTPLEVKPMINDSVPVTPPPPVAQVPTQMSTPGPAATGQSAFDFFENISSTAGTPVPSGGEILGAVDQPTNPAADIPILSTATSGPSQPARSPSSMVIPATATEAPTMPAESNVECDVAPSAPVETLTAGQVSGQEAPLAPSMKKPTTLISEAPVFEMAPAEEDSFSVIDPSTNTGPTVVTSTELPGQPSWQASMGDLDDLVLGQQPLVDKPSTQYVPSTIPPPPVAAVSPTPPSDLADSLALEPVPSAERQGSSLVTEPTPVTEPYPIDTSSFRVLPSFVENSFPEPLSPIKPSSEPDVSTKLATSPSTDARSRSFDEASGRSNTITTSLEGFAPATHVVESGLFANLNQGYSTISPIQPKSDSLPFTGALCDANHSFFDDLTDQQHNAAVMTLTPLEAAEPFHPPTEPPAPWEAEVSAMPTIQHESTQKNSQAVESVSAPPAPLEPAEVPSQTAYSSGEVFNHTPSGYEAPLDPSSVYPDDHYPVTQPNSLEQNQVGEPVIPMTPLLSYRGEQAVSNADVEYPVATQAEETQWYAQQPVDGVGAQPIVTGVDYSTAPVPDYTADYNGSYNYGEGYTYEQAGYDQTYATTPIAAEDTLLTETPVEAVTEYSGYYDQNTAQYYGQTEGEETTSYDPYAYSTEQTYEAPVATYPEEQPYQAVPPIPAEASQEQVRQEDFYRRCRGFPVAVFGFGGTLWCTFPQRAQRYDGENPTPTAYEKTFPGQMVCYSTRENHTEPEFPGPLLTHDRSGCKQKKDQVLGFIRQQLEGLRSQVYPPQELIMLWQVLFCLVENDGDLHDTPAAVASICQTLKELPYFTDSQASPTSSIGRDLKALESYLLDGNRLEALKLTLQKKLWPHALLISSCVGKEAWQEVTQTFARDLVRHSIDHHPDLGSPQTAQLMANGMLTGDGAPGAFSALRVIYQVFAGAGSNALTALWSPAGGTLTEPSDFVPAADLGPSDPTAKHISQAKLAATKERVLHDWLRLAVIILANQTKGGSSVLTALGDELVRVGRLSQGHLCYLLSPHTSLFAARGSSQVRYTLLNSSVPEQFNHQAYLLSEVYEFALALKPGRVPATIPHLLPFKLLHAWWLAEEGCTAEATRYCDALATLIEELPKPSPFVTQSFLHQLGTLKQRLDGFGATSEASGSSGMTSWLSRRLAKPSFTSLMNAFDTGLDKLITGTDSGSTAQSATGTEDGKSMEIQPENPMRTANSMSPPRVQQSASMGDPTWYNQDALRASQFSPGLQFRNGRSSRCTSAQVPPSWTGSRAGSPYRSPRAISTSRTELYQTSPAANPIPSGTTAPVTSSPLTQTVQPTESFAILDNAVPSSTLPPATEYGAPVDYNYPTSYSGTTQGSSYANDGMPYSTETTTATPLASAPSATEPPTEGESSGAPPAPPLFFQVERGDTIANQGQVDDNGFLNVAPVPIFGGVPTTTTAPPTFNYGGGYADHTVDDDLGFGNNSLSKTKPTRTSTDVTPQTPGNSNNATDANQGSKRDSSPSANPSTSHSPAVETSSPNGDSSKRTGSGNQTPSNVAGGGMFGRLRSLFGSGAKTGDGGSAAVKANLGEESSFYYDPVQKRWVNKNASEEEQPAAAPPPPPPSYSSSVTSRTAPPGMAGRGAASPPVWNPNGNNDGGGGGGGPPRAAATPPPSSSLPYNPASAPMTPVGGPGKIGGVGGPSSARTRRGARSRYVDILNPNA